MTSLSSLTSTSASPSSLHSEDGKSSGHRPWLTGLLRHYVLLLGIGALVFFTNLGEAQLWDRDEPRNAGCAEEMLTRGDWVVPVFNNQLRDAKPVLLYWLIMSAYGMFGVSEFAARFWSAALAIGTMLATYHIGRRLFSPTVGCWAAIILATCLMFDVAGHAATPDSVLIFCTTTALMIYVLGSFPTMNEAAPVSTADLAGNPTYFPTTWPHIISMYVMMGLGVLAKGPIGFLLPMAIIGMFLLIVRLPRVQSGESQTGAGPQPPEGGLDQQLGVTGQSTKRWSVAAVVLLLIVAAQLWGLVGLLAGALLVAAVCSAFGRQEWFAIGRVFGPRHFLRTAWSMRPLTGALVVLAVALPWYVAVGFATEGDFLWGFFLKEHFGRASTAMENHSGSPLFYPVAILIGFFPWSVFAVPLLIDVRSRYGDYESRERPGLIFAACWIGVVVGLFTLAATKLPSYVTVCYPALALVAGGFIDRWARARTSGNPVWERAAMGCLTAVGGVMIIGLPIAATQYVPGHEWLGAIGVVPLITGLACWAMLRKEHNARAAWTFAGGAVTFSVLAFGFVAGQVSQHQYGHVLLEEISRRSDDATIASYGCLESTWVFYAKQPIHELTAGRKPASATAKFLRQNSEPFIITNNRSLPALERHLPSEYGVVADVPYFLKRDRLLLIGRKQDVHAAVADDDHRIRR